MRIPLLLAVLGAARPIMACTFDCKGDCSLPASVIFKVEGYEIVGGSTNCPQNGWPVYSAPGEVAVQGRLKPAVCHVRVDLDDGSHVEADVPFDTKAHPIGCCGSLGGEDFFVAGTPPILIAAPSGYVPKTADAAADGRDSE